jgi:hypothetical protein
MGKKCCVYGCKTNYLSANKSSGDMQVSVFRFPKDEDEKQAWVSAIPNAKFTFSKNTVVCELHWPSGFEKVSKKGKTRPKDPPSVWPNVPSSQIPSPAPPPRTTKRSSCSERNTEEDQLAAFLMSDNVTFCEIKDKLLASERDLPVPVIAYMDGDVLNVQSKKLLNGVPLFIVRILTDQSLENFHLGVKCTASSLSKNRITALKTWSSLEENIRFLNCLELDDKKEIIQQQLQAMGTQHVGKPLYNSEIIIRAFQYFATSRSLYQRLRQDFQLPSVQTLTRITSKVAKLDETSFSTAVFKSVEERQRQCVLLQDEVYVKKMMLYHGGQIFGRSVDNPQCLAKTVLGMMVSCLFGGPNFLSKILPISRLKSTFLHEQVQLSIDYIEQAGGQVNAVICDGNRINQALFKLFAADPQTPWKTQSDIFLLYDYVHILKNIRNNWLTELTGELTFEVDGVTRTAKWRHLLELYKLECDSLVKMSDLNEVAVSPKPIERQKVSTCLKVFSEKTSHALLHHPGMEKFDGVADTAIFINKVLTWWKILNVKSQYMDIRRNDDLQAAISDPCDERLETILKFGDMALQMGGKQGKRQKQLTRDTSQAIFHTCNGLVNLCRQLLSTSHQYVLFGQFSTDPLEKEFSKLRQGSGGTYFISVQQIVEKSNINRAKLLLALNTDTAAMDVEDPGHACSDCGFAIESNEKACEAVDNLEELEASISVETKSVLIYIAGYVTRKDPELDEVSQLGQTTFYFEKFGQYTNSLDRGGLNIPSDRSCQWTIFSFILFNVVKDSVCRKSFSKIALTLSDTFEFEMEERHARILSNIFIKNYCSSSTPRSTKEPALKRLKLSETS